MEEKDRTENMNQNQKEQQEKELMDWFVKLLEDTK